MWAFSGNNFQFIFELEINSDLANRYFSIIAELPPDYRWQSTTAEARAARSFTPRCAK
jgi:hypothetical protein